MMVGDLAATMVFFQAPRAMDLLRREILGAIESHQVVAIQKTKLLQSPTALQSRKDVAEGRPEVFRIDRIEDFSHARVTRHVLHVEDHLQALFVLLSPLVERQHGGILQCEHGQSAH